MDADVVKAPFVRQRRIYSAEFKDGEIVAYKPGILMTAAALARFDERQALSLDSICKLKAAQKHPASFTGVRSFIMRFLL